MTFTNEGKLILFETAFEVKTSLFFRLIEASGKLPEYYTLSAALISSLSFELLTCKICGWSTAKFDDKDWNSEPESFTLNRNSNWTGFSFFGLHLLNDNLLCLFFGWLNGRLWLIAWEVDWFFQWIFFKNFSKWQSFLSILGIQINRFDINFDKRLK